MDSAREGPTGTIIEAAASVAATEIGDGAAAAPAKRPPAVDAQAIRRWLTPATLRSQFILTEILQPPLALREPPGLRTTGEPPYRLPTRSK